ncbi:hypothetical protein NIE88_02645 [Sporolactobacillus shoreicorticis]|uniref:PTS sugar transporter subunit IIA n=1 Tax=Sporolactobacillus shoreicorticis TaxID=1923877 RepID=A0ABW5S0K4_9BACL|nr:hypothetical protein [Sporolactobacillus shoreicorticis]MCO7124677.1 hypothetical protein [Sporolactobacillus shoreicorticis]
MIRKFILISHSELANGMHRSLEYIMGRQPNVSSFGLLGNETPDKIIEKIKKKIEPSDFVVVLGDISGGSMCNAARVLLDQPNVVLVGGVNLPLLIELIMSPAQTKEEVVKIVEDLRSSMKVIDTDKQVAAQNLEDFLDN